MDNYNSTKGCDFRFSGGTFWLVGRLTIKLCSVLGICHRYIMGLSTGSPKDHGILSKAQQLLGRHRIVLRHEAKVPLPVGWRTSKGELFS